MASHEMGGGQSAKFPHELRTGFLHSHTSLEAANISSHRHRVSESPTPPGIGGEGQEIDEEGAHPAGRFTPYPLYSCPRRAVYGSAATSPAAPQSSFERSDDLNRNLISDSSEVSTAAGGGADAVDGSGQVLGAVALLLLAASKTAPRLDGGGKDSRGGGGVTKDWRTAALAQEASHRSGTVAASAPTIAARRNPATRSPVRSSRAPTSWAFRASPASPRIPREGFSHPTVAVCSQPIVGSNPRQGVESGSTSASASRVYGAAVGGGSNGSSWRERRIKAERQSSPPYSRFPANSPGVWQQGGQERRGELGAPSDLLRSPEVAVPTTMNHDRIGEERRNGYGDGAGWAPQRQHAGHPTPPIMPFRCDRFERFTEQPPPPSAMAAGLPPPPPPPSPPPPLPSTWHCRGDATLPLANRDAIGTTRGRRSPSPPRVAGRKKPAGYRGSTTYAAAGQAGAMYTMEGQPRKAVISRKRCASPGNRTRDVARGTGGHQAGVVVDTIRKQVLESSNKAGGGGGDGGDDVGTVNFAEASSAPEPPKRGRSMGRRQQQQQQQKQQQQRVVEKPERPVHVELVKHELEHLPPPSVARVSGEDRIGRGLSDVGGKSHGPGTQKRHRPGARKASPEGDGESESLKLRRACDYCTGKKAGCTGGQPCLLCSRKGLECVFSVSQKQRLPRGETPKVLASRRPAAMDLDEQVSDLFSEYSSKVAQPTRPSPRKKGNNLVWSQFRKACDRCTDKKVRCDGSNPTGGFKACTPCKRAGESCLFGICRRSGPRDAHGHKTAVAGVIMKRDDFEKVTERLGQCRTDLCRFVNEDGSFCREHFHCRIGDCSFAGKNMSALLLHRGTSHAERPETDGLPATSNGVLTSEVVKEASALSTRRACAVKEV